MDARFPDGPRIAIKTPSAARHVGHGRRYSSPMPVSVEYTDQFRTWWDTLSISHQEATSRTVQALAKHGVRLGFPHSSAVKTSRHSHMRELRIQTRPRIRVFYAFDPRRSAILLIGGHKTSDERFYRDYVRQADMLYDEHLRELCIEASRHSHHKGPSR